MKSMDFGLYTSAAYMSVLEDWQGSVAGNLSASASTGFKGQTFAIEGVEPKAAAHRSAALPGISMPRSRSARNYAIGESRPTGNPMDFAIQGNGFFGLQTPDGQTVYTRDGSFHLNADGTLVSKEGFPVLGNGGLISLPPQDGPIAVARDGTLSQDGRESGQLALFEFVDPSNLTKLGNQHFSDPGNRAGVQPVEHNLIQQGYLETSNVEPLREMVNLISISRSYEAAQKLITTIDELQGKAIQTLGNPT